MQQTNEYNQKKKQTHRYRNKLVVNGGESQGGEANYHVIAEDAQIHLSNPNLSPES